MKLSDWFSMERPPEPVVIRTLADLKQYYLDYPHGAYPAPTCNFRILHELLIRLENAELALDSLQVRALRHEATLEAHELRILSQSGQKNSLGANGASASDP